MKGCRDDDDKEKMRTDQYEEKDWKEDGTRIMERRNDGNDDADWETTAIKTTTT